MTIEQAREILKNKKLSDKEIEKILNLVQELVRLYFEKNNV